MSDFGSTGKLTIRAHDVAAMVKLSVGEYIHYKLTVQGAEPIFTYACKHRARLSEHQFSGHPKQVYEWTWCRTTELNGVPNQRNDASDDMYVVTMAFITALKYTLVAEQRDRNDGTVRVLKDIDYESQSPEDTFTETLRVFTA